MLSAASPTGPMLKDFIAQATQCMIAAALQSLTRYGSDLLAALTLSTRISCSPCGCPHMEHPGSSDGRSDPGIMPLLLSSHLSHPAVSLLQIHVPPAAIPAVHPPNAAKTHTIFRTHSQVWPLTGHWFSAERSCRWHSTKISKQQIQKASLTYVLNPFWQTGMTVHACMQDHVKPMGILASEVCTLCGGRASSNIHMQVQMHLKSLIPENCTWICTQ